MSEHLAEQIFRTASESIDVLSPPVDAVVAEAGEQRRQRRRTAFMAVAGGAAVVAGVVGLATWMTTRPSSEPSARTAAHLTLVKNPLDVAWYATGRLHLADVTVDLPAVTTLVGVGGGAVYGDSAGTVGYVAEDGSVTVLGTKSPTAPVVVSERDGWAAWVDAPGDGTELVVHDLVHDRTLGFVSVPRGSFPIAVDQSHVFYATPDGDFTWTPGTDPEPLGRDGLLDVDSATRVYQAGRRGVEMVQSFFSVSFRRPGDGAQLSPGGTFLLTRPPGSGDDDGPFRPLLYDARSGDAVPAGMPAGAVAIDAAFGPNHTVSYLVVRRAELSESVEPDAGTHPPAVLRTCEVGTSDCHDIVPLARSRERPLLAH
jgi:hypothetical protein